MLLVHRDHVGPVAFERMQRSGELHDVLGAWALPADITSTRALRLHMVAPLTPAHMWLTALTALWLEGFGPVTGVIHLAGARGSHRTIAAPGSPPLRFHTGNLHGLPDAGSPHVATLARACLDSLWHCPPHLAIPAVASAVRSGETSTGSMRDLLRRWDRHTAGHTRVGLIVDALEQL